MKKIIKRIIFIVFTLMSFIYIDSQIVLAVDNLEQSESIVSLPDGSTSDELQSVVNNSTSGGIIEIGSNMHLDISIKIPEGKKLTIRSKDNSNYTILSTSKRHFIVKGELILQNITLNGSARSGGVSVNGGKLIINNGTKITDCNAEYGGGVYVDRGNLVINRETKITNCNATNGGGGVYVYYGNLAIYGGTISNNTSSEGGGIIFDKSNANINGGEISNNNVDAYTSGSGGGISIKSNSIVTISGDTKISSNTAKGYIYSSGGGIYIENSKIQILKDVQITDNRVIAGLFAKSSYGGGIYVYKSQASILENVKISGNTAVDGGGGIYIDLIANLQTGEQTVFSGNKAATAYYPPDNAINLYPNIKFASVSISNHPLNNYDINYSESTIIPYYRITYNSNGGTGSYIGPKTIPGDTDTILSSDKAGISYVNYNFANWNTKPDGKGTSYTPDSTITLKDNVTLYAQWLHNVYTVTFESNGGSPVDTKKVSHGQKVIKPDDPTKESFMFDGWYNEKTLETVWDFDNNLVTKDLILYAKWVEQKENFSEMSKPSELPESPVSLESESLVSSELPESPVPLESSEIDIPKTGDNSSIGLWLLAIAITSIALISLSSRIRR